MKSKQMEIKEQVSLGGYPQNCYRIATSGGQSVQRTVPTVKGYVSLEKKTLPNGYVEELTIKDYPINSQSVSSLADGADYRNDPAQAVANAPKRVNLGDVTEAQAFLQNPQNQARIYHDVMSKLLDYYKNQAVKPDKLTPSTEEGGK